MAAAELTLWFAIIAVGSFTATFTIIAVYLWWRALGREDEDIEAGRVLNKSQRLRHLFALKTLNSFASSESTQEALLPFLQDDALGLEEFLKIGEKLGPQWSEEDLSEIALLLDVSPQDTEGCKALPPIVSSWRLRGALQRNGFAAQFPHAAGLCNHDLLKALEDTLAKPGRRSLPTGATAPPAPPGPPPGPGTGSTGATAPPAPKAATGPPRPVSPAKSAGDASYGDDEFDEEFEDDFEDVEEDVEEEEA